MYAGAECRDRTRCTSYATCTDDDALRRSGHTCSGFPYYNGGAPFIESASWKTKNILGSCDIGGDGSCASWSANGTDAAVTDKLFGRCLETLSSGACIQWRTSQSLVEPCPDRKREFPGDGSTLIDGTTIGTRCCSTKGTSVYSCVDRDIELNYDHCTCSKVLANGGSSYCAEWSCKAYDDAGGDDVTASNYSCTTPYAGSGACQEWTGIEDNADHFVLTSCKCLATGGLGSSKWCNAWDCAHKEMNYHDPPLSWIAYGIIMGGVFCAVGFFGMYSCFQGWNNLFGALATLGVILVVCAAVILPATLRGGFIVFLVTTLFLIILFVILWVARILPVFNAKRNEHNRTEPADETV